MTLVTGMPLRMSPDHLFARGEIDAEGLVASNIAVLPLYGAGADLAVERLAKADRHPGVWGVVVFQGASTIASTSDASGPRSSLSRRELRRNSTAYCGVE